MVERSISPCRYPGCRATDGQPELTRDVICQRSRGHYRWVLDDLAGYYVTIRSTMPSPVAVGTTVVTKNSARSYGHPREWASDTLRAIADTFNGWEDAVRDYRNDGAAPPALVSEPLRVEHGLRYLGNWFDTLCTFPGAGDAALEFHELRRGIRSAMGHTRRLTRLPAPCPECDLLLLVRIGEDLDDYIECRNPDCGVRIRPEQYGAWTRILTEDVLNQTVTIEVPVEGCA